MPRPSGSNRPDRVTNPEASNPSSAASWAITLPLDKEVARLERTWGSLDFWLSQVDEAEIRERWARVWAKLNRGIETIDLEMTRDAVTNALKWIKHIDKKLANAGISPPEPRFISNGDLVVAETHEDAVLLHDRFDGDARVYTLEEVAHTIANFEREGGPLVRLLKEEGARLVGLKQPSSEPLNDELPF